MPIIDDIKTTIERDLAEDRRLLLGTMTASQIKALFDLLPDPAWLQIAQHMVRQEPKALGDYLINVAITDPAAYEPHYATITSPDQVQIYEAIIQDSEGNVTTTLLKGAGYLKHNILN